MKPPVPESMPEFISKARVARMLACNANQVPDLARRGLLTVRRLPGARFDRYCLDDVLKLRARMIAGPARASILSPPPGKPERPARRRETARPAAR